MGVRFGWVMVWALLFAATVASAQESPLHAIEHAEAVRSDWETITPPDEGWLAVPIPDFSNRHWRNFNGVVWYRMEWEQADPAQDTGLVIEHLNMAGAVYVNGTLLLRDASLVEPLSRMWKVPRYLSLAPPLLKAGRNTLLVRLSALDQYGPRVGRISVGEAAAAYALYERYKLLRVDLLEYTFAVDATLGVFFLTLWLMRRGEVAFGWYGLSTLLWLGYQINFIATSPWPFSRNETWASVNACFLTLFVGAYAVFVLRFCERRWPRAESAMWATIAIAVAVMLSLPEGASDPYRVKLIIATGAFGLTANVLLLSLTWRDKRLEPRLLCVAAWLYLVAGTHDLLAFRRIFFTSDDYYTDATAFVNTLCIAAVLAWRYARSLDRIEQFNVRLHNDVAAARNELAENLKHQHEIEMTHARLGERLNLVRDLHDGLGGSLLGSIAAIEHAPEKLSAPYLLKLLRGLRDELRLIVDTAIIEPAGEASALVEQLAPLRHRMSRLLEASGIACRWDLSGIDALVVTSAQTLDVLRFVQEALTNVLKHSGACEACIGLHASDAGLSIEVCDNGGGLGDTPGQGAGLRSMQMRAQRLGGRFAFSSNPGETRVAIVGALAATP
ncbi:MAG: hypothetical protein JSR65_03670 [Proteobacteria bacterium]|nr:hypothetical protein [Pseudomonadota bacterium]